MPQRHPRRRLVAAVLLATTLPFALSACSFATLDENNPGAGANAVVGQTHVMNVVLVKSDDGARLIASVLSPTDDTLVSVSGAPLADDGTAEEPFAPVRTGIQLTANQLVNLDSAAISLTSPDLASSVNARVTFTFSKAGAITVTAPITYSGNPAYQS